MLHWHTNEPAPPEYLRFILYDRFGWTPAEVEAIELSETLTILTIISEEHKYQNRPKGKTVNSA